MEVTNKEILSCLNLPLNTKVAVLNQFTFKTRLLIEEIEYGMWEETEDECIYLQRITDGECWIVKHSK
jgi:hypothetical protein